MLGIQWHLYQVLSYDGYPGRSFVWGTTKMPAQGSLELGRFAHTLLKSGNWRVRAGFFPDVGTHEPSTALPTRSPPFPAQLSTLIVPGLVELSPSQ